MFKAELYGRVRRAVLVEGRSQRAGAREFGLSRESVGKMLRYSVPPGYQRQQAVKRPKLGPWLGVIDAILPPQRRRPVAGDPGWKKTSGGQPGSGIRRSGSSIGSEKNTGSVAATPS
jgi:hypothetical protein